MGRRRAHHRTAGVGLRAGFDGYPAVLVRLAEIDVEDLEEVLTRAWLTQAPRKLVQEFLADSS